MFILSMSASMIPHGYYAAKIQLPLVASQHIAIQVDAPSTGQITLKGAVNIKENFSFSKQDEIWTVELGSRVKRVMQKTSCHIMAITFDELRDIAKVKVILPLLGTKTLIFTKDSLF